MHIYSNRDGDILKYFGASRRRCRRFVVSLCETESVFFACMHVYSPHVYIVEYILICIFYVHIFCVYEWMVGYILSASRNFLVPFLPQHKIDFGIKQQLVFVVVLCT